MAGIFHNLLLSGVMTLASIGSAPAAATSADALDNKEKLTIGIHNRSPWGFRGADGEATGFHPDLVRAAFAPLGIDNIEFVIADFGALIPGLIANRFDMIASGIAITPARCKAVIFSEPDLAVGDSLIVKQGNPYNIHSYADIVANKKIRLGGGRGTLNTKNAVNSGVPDAQMVLFQDTESVISAVIAGRVDAATLSAPSVIAALQDRNIKGVERATPFTGLIRDGHPAAMYTAIAFRPKDTALRDAYNKQLAVLKNDGTVKKIMGKYGFTDEEEVSGDITTEKICAE
ncbi:ectoine/hydroxyectoine ABC transporter substrate-binding protein EhuB [Allopusillimonas ginsengisoli]|nr:ectoine/hydroxyectoine ABC transporter substrate-binding protein EhuB [Allopusillimonas ginsengisoli]